MFKEESSKQITISTVIIGSGMIFSKAVTLFAETVVARELGKNTFGPAIFGYALLLTYSTVVLFGLPQGLTHYISIYEQRDDYESLSLVVSSASLVVASVSLATLLFVNTGAGFVLMATVLTESQIRWVRLLSPLLVCYPVSRLCISVLRAYQQSVKKVISDDIVNKILSLLSILIVLKLGTERLLFQSFYLLQYVLSSVITSFYVLNILRGVVKPPSRRTAFGSSLSEFTSYVAPVGAKTAARRIIGNSDIILLGVLVAGGTVGTYRVGYVVAQLGMIPLMAVLYSYTPAMSRHYESGTVDAMRRRYVKTTNYAVVLGIPLSATLVLFPGEIIEFLFGPGYREARFVLMVLGADVALRVCMGVAGSTMLAIERTREDLGITLVGMMVNLTISVPLILWFDTIGAAVGTLLSVLMINISQLYLVWKYVGIQPYTRPLIKTVGILSPAIAAVYYATVELFGDVSLTRIDVPLSPTFFTVASLLLTIIVATSVGLRGTAQLKRYVYNAI